MDSFHAGIDESERDESDMDRLLDLLADGELNESDRCDVLAWCQRHPQGWRRCALALLEAQTWRTELRYLAREPVAALPLRPSAVEEPVGGFGDRDRAGEAGTTSVSSPQRLRPLGWLLAMAASFLLAFALGLAVQDVRAPAELAPEVARQDSTAAQFAGTVAAPGKSSRDPAAPIGDSRPTPKSWSNVRLVVDGGPGSAPQEIDVPVVERDSLDEQWLWGHPSAVPAEVERALERLGHRVRQQRRLLPFDLNDGRRVIVPVDQVEVQPVGRRSFQ